MDLSRYYSDISKTPLLSKDEEMSLLKKAKDPSATAEERLAARTAVVTANLRFAFKTALKYSRRAPDIFSELISAGNEGLLVGIDKYDPEKGFRFLTYAGWWVEQRILECMSSQRIVSIPVRKQQIAAQIERQVNSNPSITTEELMKLLPKVSKKDIEEMRSTNYLTYFIEDMTKGDPSSMDHDPAFQIDPIGEGVDIRLDNEKLTSALSTLTDDERLVIDLLFGISSGEEATVQEVAKLTNTTRACVKDLRASSLKKLKEELGDDPSQWGF